MKTIICDRTALLYWRTPPIVRLLASAPEDDELLRSIVGEQRLRQFRDELAQESVLVQTLRGDTLRKAHFGPEAERIRQLAYVLAPSVRAPVDLLAHAPNDRRASQIAHPRVWQEKLPPGSELALADGTSVVSPEFALLEIASRASLVQTALLCSEFCGKFAVYRAPQAVDRLLQELAGQRRLPSYEGWTPVLGQDGTVGTLWTRDPLCTPEGLLACADASASRKGRARLCKATALVVPGAASPFEVQAGILLGWGPRLGGEGYAGFEHNHLVRLLPSAQRVAQRSHCVCDLYWAGDDTHRALDVECQSEEHHAGGHEGLSDANRATALQIMGTDVIELTYGQLTDTARFTAVSRLVAKRLGRDFHEKTQLEWKKALGLRKEIFVDWASLADV